MKVLLINGSPHEKGCTYTALTKVAETIRENGIETQIYHIGNKPVRGCIACGACEKLEKCVFEDDSANEILELIQEADGIIIGSPVYYAGPNGALCALLDRVFFSSKAERISYKPAAAIVSARRGGTTAAFDRLNKYFTINRMPVVSSQYWNGVHGMTPEEVLRDEEGMQIMHTLGNNMAWMLKTLANKTEKAPEIEEWKATNFIR